MISEISELMVWLSEKKMPYVCGDVTSREKFIKAQYGTYGNTFLKIAYKNVEILEVKLTGETETYFMLPSNMENEEIKKVAFEIAKILKINLKPDSSFYVVKR